MTDHLSPTTLREQIKQLRQIVFVHCLHPEEKLVRLDDVLALLDAAEVGLRDAATRKDADVRAVEPDASTLPSTRSLTTLREQIEPAALSPTYIRLRDDVLETVADMKQASDGVDDANGTSDHISRLVALALISREFLRRFYPALFDAGQAEKVEHGGTLMAILEKGGKP